MSFRLTWFYKKGDGKDFENAYQAFGDARAIFNLWFNFKDKYIVNVYTIDGREIDMTKGIGFMCSQELNTFK